MRNIEDICRKLLSAQQNEYEEKLRRAEDCIRALSEQQLKTEELVRGMEERILERVEKRLEDKIEKLDDNLRAELGVLEETVAEIEHHVDQRVDLEVEDRVLGIKSEMQDFVEDEMKSVTDSIKQQVQEASIYIEFQ